MTPEELFSKIISSPRQIVDADAVKPAVGAVNNITSMVCEKTTSSQILDCPNNVIS